jgi:hypothetical protein
MFLDLHLVQTIFLVKLKIQDTAKIVQNFILLCWCKERNRFPSKVRSLSEGPADGRASRELGEEAGRGTPT